MTYDECMARLAACEPMARGERMSCVTRLRVATQWCRMYWASMLPQDRMMRDWRAYAAPLRHEREERQVWRAATFAAGELRTSEAVGAALLGFFSDLAILVRKTPAPCPWCGSKTFLVAYGRYVMCRQCEATGPHMFAADPVHAFNRVAVVAAFARLKDGE